MNYTITSTRRKLSEFVTGYEAGATYNIHINPSFQYVSIANENIPKALGKILKEIQEIEVANDVYIWATGDTDVYIEKVS